MKVHKQFILVLVCMLLTACGTVLPPIPQSTDQKIAYGYAAVSTIRLTATQLLQNNTISVEDAKIVEALANQCRSSLDTARVAITTGKTDAAMQALTMATGILAKVQEYLDAKQGKGVK